MNHVLELRYRRLLRAYPKEYRAEHGEELIGTLLEAAPPGARRPSLRETLHLLAGGFTARVLAARASGVPSWRDGLHLGALVVALVTFAQLPVLPYFIFKTWTALGIVLMVALVRGWMRVAACLATFAALWTSQPMIPGLIPALDLGPLYGDLAPVAPYWVVAAASAVLAVRRAGADRGSGRARRWGATMPARSARWLLVPLGAGVRRVPVTRPALPGREPAGDRRPRLPVLERAHRSGRGLLGRRAPGARQGVTAPASRARGLVGGAPDHLALVVYPARTLPLVVVERPLLTPSSAGHVA
ncbi:hypothetical protein [Nonomuraea sp. NPDC049607]|uniref:hypothetical protein n=1 Tax=Nonomuraea sp. NPDC049607 TaxID=3154732 RepID=UPI00342B426A